MKAWISKHLTFQCSMLAVNLGKIYPRPIKVSTPYFYQIHPLLVKENAWFSYYIAN